MDAVPLIVTTFAAAVVNGAPGYGFSSSGEAAIDAVQRVLEEILI